MTVTELIVALSQWHENPDELIGVPETREIEFKAEPYRLQENIQKLEFAKDVSAMANGAGGIIVLGVRTEPDPAIGRDVSVEVTPLALGAVNADQMHQIASTWVYPPLRDLEIREWSTDDEMLVSIRVPPSTEPGSLHLMRAADIEGRVNRKLFGIAMRSEAMIDYLGPEEVFSWIRIGRLRGALPGPGEDLGAPRDEADEELERIEALFEGNEWPVFVLQAWPGEGTRLERIHDRDGIRGVLLDAPALRPQGGFNLRWAVTPEPYRQGGIAMTVAEREGLRILPGGVVTFFGSGGPHLLSWGMERYNVDPPAINPWALCELTYEFCRLVLRELFPRSAPRPQQALFRIALLYARRPRPAHLAPGVPGMLWAERVRAVNEDRIQAVVGPLPTTEVPERVTAQLLERLYAHFGLGTEAIPFLDEERAHFDPDRLVEEGTLG